VVLPKGIVASGFPRIRETCRKIGVEFDPWQTDLNRCLLAKTADGLYAADTAVISIPRQVGKTFDVGAVVFAECIVTPGTTVVWTAHRFKVSRETFNELRALAKSPKLAPHIDYDAITTAAGNECIPFRNGSRIVFAARERGAIRGFTKVRILILDEAQILTEATLADLAPTMNQAANPLIILMGTPPKPSDPGEVFTNLRAEALSGDSDGIFYVEFSAEPGSDPDDRAAWRQANPSYPHRTPARAILRMRKLLSNDDFLREALGIWDSDAHAGIDLELWTSLADPDAPRGANPVFGVATAPDRSWSAVGVAWKRPDGAVQVMLAEYRETATWVAEHVAGLRKRWGGRVLVDIASRDLVSDAEELSPGDLAKAHNAFSDAVTASKVYHGNEPALNVAVKASQWRPSGDTRVLDRKGHLDISPLAAVALAAYGAAQPPAKPGRLVVF
jgi:hypothetical protein